MFKQFIKLSFELLFMLTMLFCLTGHRMLIYAISQGKGQLTIIWNSQPIEEVLQDSSFPDSLKQKLRLIIEIKKFAIDSIGINPSDNYSIVYNQHNKSILQTVTACEPYSLKANEWTFPFLGSVPYKGFFNKNEARKEILALNGKGYDVSVYSPSGWSTLGWFKDPILSNMLYKSDGQLANLIIHELTHGTIYVKNDVTFNENLANFIGDKGAEMFLIYKYGPDSKQYIDYEQSKKDVKCYNEYILNCTLKLDSLYSTLSISDAEEIKKQKKSKLITEIVMGVNRLPLFKKKNYFNYSLQAFSEKNAFFMSFTRYDSQYEIFDKIFKDSHQSDLRNYFAFLKEKYH